MPEVTFNYTGAEQTWSVPANVTSITFDVQGAQGPTFLGGGVTYGRGAQVTGKLAVTPGELLRIYVGGGASGSLSVPGTGGWNGGGNGGSPTGNYGASWGGAGASDIRRGGSALSNRVVVAGGGGGGGGDGSVAGAFSGGAPGAGGGGGLGVTEAPGGSGSSGTGFTPGTGGEGGQTSRGGNAGTGNDATAGALGVGGQGGSGNGPGGGGGGGYYGGGGGGGGTQQGQSGGGGGGAGSSYAGPGTSSVETTGGVRGDFNGIIIISWITPSPAANATWTTLAGAYDLNAGLTLTFTTDATSQTSRALRRTVGSTVTYLSADGTWSSSEQNVSSTSTTFSLTAPWALAADPDHSYAVKVWNGGTPGLYSPELFITPFVQSGIDLLEDSTAVRGEAASPVSALKWTPGSGTILSYDSNEKSLSLTTGASIQMVTPYPATPGNTYDSETWIAPGVGSSPGFGRLRQDYLDNLGNVIASAYGDPVEELQLYATVFRRSSTASQEPLTQATMRGGEFYDLVRVGGRSSTIATVQFQWRDAGTSTWNDVGSVDLTSPYTLDTIGRTTWRSSAHASVNQGTATAPTITKPSGTVQDDRLILFATMPATPDRTMPAEWELLGVSTAGWASSLGTLDTQTWIWSKIAGASEPATYTVGGGNSTKFALTMITVTGTSSLAIPVLTANGSISSPVSQSVTSSLVETDGSLFVGAFHEIGSNTVTLTGTGSTVVRSTANGWMRMSAVSMSVNSPDAYSLTVNASATGHRWAAFGVVIPPATTGVPLSTFGTEGAKELRAVVTRTDAQIVATPPEPFITRSSFTGRADELGIRSAAGHLIRPQSGAQMLTDHTTFEVDVDRITGRPDGRLKYATIDLSYSNAGGPWAVARQQIFGIVSAFAGSGITVSCGLPLISSLSANPGASERNTSLTNLNNGVYDSDLIAVADLFVNAGMTANVRIRLAPGSGLYGTLGSAQTASSKWGHGTTTTHEALWKSAWEHAANIFLTRGIAVDYTDSKSMFLEVSTNVPGLTRGGVPDTRKVWEYAKPSNSFISAIGMEQYFGTPNGKRPGRVFTEHAALVAAATAAGKPYCYPKVGVLFYDYDGVRQTTVTDTWARNALMGLYDRAAADVGSGAGSPLYISLDRTAVLDVIRTDGSTLSITDVSDIKTYAPNAYAEVYRERLGNRPG